MKDKTEIWWGLYLENTTQGRHHEQQRTAITSFFTALAAGIVGIITLDGCINISDIPLALFLIMVGVFGAFFSAKQYERYNVHMLHARAFRNALEDELPDTEIRKIKHQADHEAARRFPVLNRSPLAVLWIGLHLLIAAFGAFLAIGAQLQLFACVGNTGP